LPLKKSQRNDVLAATSRVGLDPRVYEDAQAVPTRDGTDFQFQFIYTVQPQAFQSMIVMLAHGVASLFGGTPPPTIPQTV
jgi:hypothetical protein